MNKLISFALLLFSLPALAQTELQEMKDSAFLPESNPDHEFNYQEINEQSFDNFEAAAQWADVVAIAQLHNTDYSKTRELNAKGQAFLSVRVPYKGVRKNELLIVNTKGFEEYACYYPDKAGMEGQRFLVFLKATPSDGEYVGFKPMCQLPILLTDTGQYALKFPIDADIQLDEKLIHNITFRDPHATIDTSDWTHIKRETYAKDQFMTLSEKEDMFQKHYYLTYTKGIMMYEIRKLMNIPVKQRITSKQK